MQEEALKLADELDALHQYVPTEAPVMIRRLVEELDKQGEPVARIVEDLDIEWTKVHKLPVGTLLYTTPQTKPLSDEEIKQIFADQTGYYIDSGLVKGLAVMDFARAIEERHGIK